MKTKVVVVVALAAVAVYIALRPRAPARTFAVPTQPGASSAQSGGTLATLGAWFGVASQLIDPGQVAPDRSTPTSNASVISNPVSSSPAVLPYSYKQAVIDVPGLLGTDDIFTPSVGSGGAYSENDIAGTSASPLSDGYDGYLA